MDGCIIISALIAKRERGIVYAKACCGLSYFHFTSSKRRLWAIFSSLRDSIICKRLVLKRECMDLLLLRSLIDEPIQERNKMAYKAPGTALNQSNVNCLYAANLLLVLMMGFKSGFQKSSSYSYTLPLRNNSRITNFHRLMFPTSRLI